MQKGLLISAASKVNWIMNFVIAQQHVKSTTWQSLAATIRPLGEFAGQCKRHDDIAPISEQLLGALHSEMTRTLQQAESNLSVSSGDQHSNSKAEDAGYLSQFEVTVYSMLLALKMLSAARYKFVQMLLEAIWAMSLQLKDLLPVHGLRGASQPCHNATSLTALLARAVISLYSAETYATHMELRGRASSFIFPFDLLFSFSLLHPSLQQAVAAEIGSKGRTLTQQHHLTISFS